MGQTPMFSCRSGGAYGRIALEYGLRFNAMGREWATWAVHQIS
jgi:hypothetical protein